MSQLKSTGREYTATVALLVVAFVVSPAILIVSGPVEIFSLSLAIACSALAMALAWVTWKRSSQLSIPSIASRPEELK